MQRDYLQLCKENSTTTKKHANLLVHVYTVKPQEIELQMAKE